MLESKTECVFGLLELILLGLYNKKTVDVI